MNKIEDLLQVVVEQGDLRRKESKLLEQAVFDACDQIGAAALKAGVWGKYMHVNLGPVDIDEIDFIAYLAKIEDPDEKVVVRLAEAWDQEQQDGFKELEIDFSDEAWTHYADFRCPSRRLTVKLAHRLEELAQTLHDRCQQLADETQQARKAAESFKL